MQSRPYNTRTPTFSPVLRTISATSPTPPVTPLRLPPPNIAPRQLPLHACGSLLFSRGQSQLALLLLSKAWRSLKAGTFGWTTKNLVVLPLVLQNQPPPPPIPPPHPPSSHTLTTPACLLMLMTKSTPSSLPCPISSVSFALLLPILLLQPGSPALTLAQKYLTQPPRAHCGKSKHAQRSVGPCASTNDADASSDKPKLSTAAQTSRWHQAAAGGQRGRRAQAARRT
jgi:hypothetical protein